MSAADVAHAIQELEQEIGRLAPVQKILLGTDGSVTQLLEIVTGGPVEINTLSQEVVPADQATADLLLIDQGEEVNHRVVELKRRDTGEVLIYAVSDTPLSRLAPEFRSDLMRADTPIGKIMQKHKIEARRDIVRMGVIRADDRFASLFGIFRQEPLLTRRYHIVHHERPLISIQETFPYARFIDETRVMVDAPSRLHLVLIDMNGGLGRVDGSIGITLDAPNTLLEARCAGSVTVKGGNPEVTERVRRSAEATLAYLGIAGGAELIIHTVVEQHTGLGSGTSLALAAASAVCALAGRTVPIPNLARVVGRGGTSGIGTASFEHGGFLIDGGHSFGRTGEKKDFKPSAASGGVAPAPLTVRHPFPPDWKILIATPAVKKGASEREEEDIFRRCCPVPVEDVREICHEVLIRMLPGLVEHDLDLFGSAVNRLQMLGFKKIEIERQPPLIASLRSALCDAGAACAGMSSFGPTVFAIGDTGMQDVERAAREMLQGIESRILLTRARNAGAHIRVA
jgi:beta-ribofuranosylaminobenzene 5'-phosphate synthase